MMMNATCSKSQQLHMSATITSRKKENDSCSTTTDSSLQEYLKCIPKVELHAHLNGCIREETLFQLAAQRNVKLSDHHFHNTSSSSSSSKNNGALLLYNVMPRSLQDCFDMFAEIPLAVNDLPALQRITYEALHDFAHIDSCAYLELRSTPKCLLLKDNSSSTTTTSTDSSHGNDGIDNDNQELLMDKRAYIETILHVMQDFEQQEEKRYQQELTAAAAVAIAAGTTATTSIFSSSMIRLPMICRLIVAVDRSQSLQEATENIYLAIEFYNNSNNNNNNNNKTDEISPPPRVVGVDLGGNPAKQDFQMFAPLFSKARRAGLKVTLHCGEVPCCVKNDDLKSNDKDTDANIIRQGAVVVAAARYDEAVAILDFKPDRLGHAMLLPPNLQARIVQEIIPVETCPTSNVMTLELTKKNTAVTVTTRHHYDNDDSKNDNGGGDCENGSHNNNNNDDGNLIAGLRHHPTLKLWLQQEEQHPLCISTDDPGVFCTSLTQELLLVATAFQIPKEQLAQIVLDSMQHAFCDSDTKSRIQKRMQQQLDQLHGQQQQQL